MELLVPVKIITDILSRLPVLTLMQCKSVSKSWRAIIDDPTFVHNYTLQHEEGFLFYTIDYRGDDQRFHYGEYNYKDTSFKLCQLINHHDCTDNKPIVVGSCRGLICLRSSSTDPYSMCIYNPFTKEHMNLPKLRCTSQCVVSGFGYHPITKQYKVVAILFNRFESSELVVYVCTLGSNQWRSKGKTSCSLCCVKPRGTQVNGALYWMNMMTEIITFDMATEELLMVPLPPQLKTHLLQQPSYNYSDLELGVLGGCLCMIEQNYSCQCSYVYVMNNNDYSWTKKSSIQWEGPYNNVYTNTRTNDYIFKKLSGKLKPVALSIHGKIWLHCGDPGTVEFYDVKTKVLHLIKILKEDMKWPKYTEIIPFTKSYVSLKALFGKEDISSSIFVLMGMHLLPGEITTDILSRLPFDSVIRCKIVCKTWQSFVIDPAFVALHARRFISSISSDQENHTYGFLILWINPKTHSYRHIRFGEYNDNDNEKISSFKLSKPTTWYPYQKRRIDWIAMNSCNGLIVMETFDTNEMAICNPCTREFVDIPPLGSAKWNKPYYMDSGFGYNPSTNEYKIVVVCYKDDTLTGKVSVYTVGSGKWRDKGETSHKFVGNQSCHLNGGVYWVNDTNEIVSFDLETEEFKIVSSPPGMYSLGTLGGCLYVIRKGFYNSADVFIRNKEDHTWSWKFSITYEELCSGCRPLAILRSGKILWYSPNRMPCVGYYDPETGILEMEKNFPEFRPWCHIMHYEKSFVSLKALGEMNARIYDSEEYVT